MNSAMNSALPQRSAWRPTSWRVCPRDNKSSREWRRPLCQQSPLYTRWCLDVIDLSLSVLGILATGCGGNQSILWLSRYTRFAVRSVSDHNLISDVWDVLRSKRTPWRARPHTIGSTIIHACMCVYVCICTSMSPYRYREMYGDVHVGDGPCESIGRGGNSQSSVGYDMSASKLITTSKPNTILI